MMPSGKERSVYLDGHATTPVDPETLDAMMPWWSSMATNAHSPHAFGQRGALAVEAARAEIARLADVASSEILFTSGATEANNIALLGVAGSASPGNGGKTNIVVSAIEHKSVLAAAEELGRQGWEIRSAPVDEFGILDLPSFDRLVDDGTFLTSVMLANNEVGSVQPIDDVIAISRNHGAMVHADAAQAVGKIPVSLSDLDFASISSHKMYGPVGVGALFVSSAAPFRPRPLIFGGGQETGLRPGTLPVPLIVGFGAAAGSRIRFLDADALHAEKLRDRLLNRLQERQVRFSVNGHESLRLPGSISLEMRDITAMELIMRLGDRVLVAEGSACNSGNIEQSHVLKAMSMSSERAERCVRMLITRHLTEDGIDYAAEEIALATGSTRQ
ncbi:cysteine desulfurase family protein [Rhizobium ruizarguesonis]